MQQIAANGFTLAQNDIGSLTFQNWCTLTSAVCAFTEILFCDFDIIKCLTDGMRGTVEVLHLRRASRCSVSESLMPITAVTHLLWVCSEMWNKWPSSAPNNKPDVPSRTREGDGARVRDTQGFLSFASWFSSSALDAIIAGLNSLLYQLISWLKH